MPPTVRTCSGSCRRREGPCRHPRRRIIGGGLIGLSVAWRAAQRGARVVRARGGGRSARARRTSPRACSRRPRRLEVGEAALLGSAARRSLRWLGGGRGSPRSSASTGCASARCSSRATPTRRRRWSASSRFRREPAGRRAAAAVRGAPARARAGAHAAPGARRARRDASVDPRRVLDALAGRLCASARRRAIREGERVEALRRRRARRRSPPAPGRAALLDGVPVPSGRSRASCCACATRAGPGLLRARRCASKAATSCRAATARYVLGATMEERGFDTTVTAGGLYELLRDAHELVPGICELVVEEAIAGLRPGTPDNAADHRRRARRRPGRATGHGRNGVLLAPLTAELVAVELAAAARRRPSARSASTGAPRDRRQRRAAGGRGGDDGRRAGRRPRHAAARGVAVAVDARGRAARRMGRRASCATARASRS